jgi:hypothetical protein
VKDRASLRSVTAGFWDCRSASSSAVMAASMPGTPARPDDFESFLENHRRWMLRLFERQFGQPVKQGVEFGKGSERCSDPRTQIGGPSVTRPANSVV